MNEPNKEEEQQRSQTLSELNNNLWNNDPFERSERHQHSDDQPVIFSRKGEISIRHSREQDLVNEKSPKQIEEMEPQRPQIDDDIDNQIMDLYNMEYLSNEDQELPFENKFDEIEFKESTFDNRQLQSFDMLLQDPNSIPFY